MKGFKNFSGLYRSRRGIFLGVCEGIAERFDFSPWGVRLLMLALQFTIVPFMILIYLGLALVMKKDPVERYYANRF